MANRAAWVVAAAAVIGGVHARPARATDSSEGSSSWAADRTLVALAVALACSDAPDAVAAPGADGATPGSTGSRLELVATVHAKALRFDVVPKMPALLERASATKVVWRTERVNLPAHPEPGVVYRDVRVRLTLTSGAPELAALLQEAKRASAGIAMEQEEAAATPTAPAPAITASETPAPQPEPADPPEPAATTAEHLR